MSTTADVLSLPVTTYLWVIGVAVMGGLVGVLNKSNTYRAAEFIKAALTSGFTGFMAFCAAFEAGWSTGWTLFSVGIAGLMGKRAWDDLENVWRMRIGAPPKPQQTDTSEAEQ